MAERDATIIVNGVEKSWSEKKITFEQLVLLAWDQPPTGPQVEITITYYRPPSDAVHNLAPGQDVPVKDNMVFNVDATDNS